MSQQQVRVGWEDLKQFSREVFVRMGVPPEDAETEAEVLIWANLRGVDSHGVLLIPTYVANLEEGLMNPRPNIRVLRETPATLLVDADRALGPVVTTMAMDRVIKKAKELGIGWCLIHNTSHQGAMGYYSLMAAGRDMAGIASVCSPPNMAPHGARAAGVHNSPIAIAVPAGRHKPLSLDMATSVAAGGKVMLAIDKGIPLPEGWGLDQDGNPTTDPKLCTTLLPAGGPKGSGLALMLECLSSLMVGNPLLVPALLGEKRINFAQQNGFLAAVDIAAFTDVASYKGQVDQLIDALKALPRTEGVDEIFVPGEPEDRIYRERLQSGIPLPEGTVRNLRAVAQKLKIELPVVREDSTQL